MGNKNEGSGRQSDPAASARRIMQDNMKKVQGQYEEAVSMAEKQMSESMKTSEDILAKAQETIFNSVEKSVDGATDYYKDFEKAGGGFDQKTFESARSCMEAAQKTVQEAVKNIHNSMNEPGASSATGGQGGAPDGSGKGGGPGNG